MLEGQLDVVELHIMTWPSGAGLLLSQSCSVLLRAVVLVIARIILGRRRLLSHLYLLLIKLGRVDHNELRVEHHDARGRRLTVELAILFREEGRGTYHLGSRVAFITRRCRERFSAPIHQLTHRDVVLEAA